MTLELKLDFYQMLENIRWLSLTNLKEIIDS